jgi:hypothetical protein
MEMSATRAQDVYEIRPRADHDGVDLISDALRFGSLWYAGPDAISNAIGYANIRSRSHGAVIRVYDEAGNVIETHEHKGGSKSGEFSLEAACPFLGKRSAACNWTSISPARPVVRVWNQTFKLYRVHK